MPTATLSLPLNGYFRPSSDATPQPWLLVLMHGVGSNAQDLFSLAPHVPAEFHLLSLQGPFTLGPDAYAWFEFSVGAQGQRTINTQPEQHSRALLTQPIRLAAEQLGVPADRVVVGGFSQGGIMSLSLLLTQPQLMKAICVWHSRLLPEVASQEVAPAQLAHHAVWLSHGTQDDVIPLSNAEVTREHLSKLPVQLSYHTYPAAHTIHPRELADCMQWLKALVDASP